MRILIVDDESEIRNVLRLLLETKGYEVVECEDGERAVALLSEDKGFDLCVMDVMMPRLSGVEATKKIRTFSTVPVLFLTAKSLDADKGAAYESGGDDYLVKPFSSKELLFKVDALTRRYHIYNTAPVKPGESDLITLSLGVTIDPDAREVKKNGEVIDVRDKEYEVLLYLSRNRGRAVNAVELYSSVWEEMPLPSSGNTVTVHILNLRRKLEDSPSSPKLIRTVWGRGYQID